MRLENWESRLSRAIERHYASPLVYGETDCFTFPADAVEAVTGERIFADSRDYTTETGAARLLRRQGFETLADAFGSLFEEIPPALAGRGDLGVVERDGEVTGGVFTALGFMVRGETGLIAVSRSQAAKAYRVI